MYICCKTREAFLDSLSILFKSRFVTRLESVAWPTSSYAVTTLIGFPYRNKAKPNLLQCQPCLPDPCICLNLHNRFSLFPGEVSHQSCIHSESLPPSPLQEGREMTMPRKRSSNQLENTLTHLIHSLYLLCINVHVFISCLVPGFISLLLVDIQDKCHLLACVISTLSGILKASDSNNCKSSVGSEFLPRLGSLVPESCRSYWNLKWWNTRNFLVTGRFGVFWFS